MEIWESDGREVRCPPHHPANRLQMPLSCPPITLLIPVFLCPRSHSPPFNAQFFTFLSLSYSFPILPFTFYQSPIMSYLFVMVFYFIVFWRVDDDDRKRRVVEEDTHLAKQRYQFSLICYSYLVKYQIVASSFFFFIWIMLSM